MKMKLIKAVVVLAVFLGTYALKDFTQFTDNVYAGGAGHEHGDSNGIEVVREDKGAAEETKPAPALEDEVRTEIIEKEDTKTATLYCGKDVTESKIDELISDLKDIGVVKVVVKKEGAKKTSGKGKTKQDEENYELSEADEDEYVLAAAWDQVLAMLRGHPVFAKEYESADISEALEERIDDRIERQVAKFVDAYVEATLKRLSNTRVVNLFDDEEDSDSYFDWDEQKEFIKDMDEKLTEEYNELADKGDTMTSNEQVRYRRLHLQLHTLDKLKKSFNRAVKEAEEVIRINSGEGTFEGDMFDPSMMFPGMDPFAGTAGPFIDPRPRSGWDIGLSSTPFGGVNFDIGRTRGDGTGFGVSGGYEHIPQKYLEMFGPMGIGAGGFGGGGFGGSFNPYANPTDFMGLGGGQGGYYPGGGL